MPASKPEFHLQRVLSDGTTGPVEIYPLLALPAGTQMSRRGFVGAGVSIASLLALLGCRKEAENVSSSPQPVVIEPQPAPDTFVPPPPPVDPPPGSQPPQEQYGHKGIVVFAHTQAVTNLRVSPDGKILVSGSFDGSVKLWSLPEAQLLHTLTVEPGVVPNDLAVLADGKSLATGWSDSTAKLWSLPAGTLLQTLKARGRIKSLAVTSDGKIMAGGTDKTIDLWFSPAGLMPLDASGVALAVSPDRKLLASGSSDSTIKLWSLPDGKLLKVLNGHAKWSHSLILLPNGKTMVGGAADNSIGLWSAADGTLQQNLVGHTDAVLTLATTPDGDMLISGSADKSVGLWSIADGKLLKSLAGHTGAVASVAVTPDGKTLVTGSADKTIKVWSLPDGKLRHTLAGHTDTIKALAITPDGATLASASGDRSYRLWSLATGKQIQKVTTQESVVALAMTPDGEAVITGTWEGSLTQRPLPGSKAPLWELLGPLDRAGRGGIQALALSADGAMLVAGCSRGCVTAWSLSERKLLSTNTSNDKPVQGLAVAADAKAVFCWRADQSVQFYPFAKGGPFRYLPGRSPVEALAFTPDGKVLASAPARMEGWASVADADKFIKLWSLPDGKLLNTVPDRGYMLVTGPKDQPLAWEPRAPKGLELGEKAIQVWSLPDGKSLYTLKGATGSVIAITPDGQTLAAGRTDGVIELWDLTTGKQRGYLFDPKASLTDAVVFNARDEVSGRTLTYTLPCGSPIPPGAVCVCNCVPGAYTPPKFEGTGYTGTGTFIPGGTYCTCNTVCICIPVCQAHRLLHDDPIVRIMAEQILLIMGPREWVYMCWAADRAGPNLAQRIRQVLTAVHAGTKPDQACWPSLAECATYLDNPDEIIAIMAAQLLQFQDRWNEWQPTVRERNQIEHLLESARRRPWFMRANTA